MHACIPWHRYFSIFFLFSILFTPRMWTHANIHLTNALVQTAFYSPANEPRGEWVRERGIERIPADASTHTHARCCHRLQHRHHWQRWQQWQWSRVYIIFVFRCCKRFTLSCNKFRFSSIFCPNNFSHSHIRLDRARGGVCSFSSHKTDNYFTRFRRWQG